MKRIICFIVFVFLLVPLSACGQSGSSSKTKIKPVSVVNMPVEEAVKALQECGAENIVTDADQYEDWAPERIIVTEQSVQEGKSISPDEEIRLTCRRLVRLYVDVKSESNLLFNTYDMDIYVDDHNLGTVKNGDSFTALAEVIEGSHEIYAYKSSNHSTSAYKQIDVNGDTTFSSRISHGGSIGFEESSVKEGILGASIEVPDVTGTVLREAMDVLAEKGFVNVREEPYGEIFNRDNWLVTGQGVKAGSEADKNEFIQLDCISLDDYFSQAYTGKTVSEIQEMADKAGFSLIYETEIGEDLTDAIQTMDPEEMENWKVTGAEQYFGEPKTARVIINNQEQKEETETEPESASSESYETNPDAVYYSTNDKETVKDGNKGVYAYKSKGGQYDLYWIIDFDEGYVYSFTEGNGGEIADKVAIESGDLNSVTIITYHDGGDVWSYGMHFKWKRQPDHLIVQDEDGFEVDYYATDLDDARKILAKKTVHNY